MEFHKGWQKYKGNYYTQKMVCNIKGNGHNIMWPVFFLVKINCFIKALICVNKILGQYQGTIDWFKNSYASNNLEYKILVQLLQLFKFGNLPCMLNLRQGIFNILVTFPLTDIFCQ